MLGFHSTVSRRDFMKGLGLIGSGLGATAVIAPVFHDIDELVSAAPMVHKWPWWVKENEINNPTVEIDWGKASRFDSRHMQQCSWQGVKEIEAAMNLRDGPGTFAKLTKDAADRKQKGLVSGDPWYDIRNKALTGGDIPSQPEL